MAAIDWDARGPSDPYYVEMSFDGEFAVLNAGLATVHYSSDFGESWSDVTPDTPVGVTGTFYLSNVAISDDGTKLAVSGFDDVDSWVFVSDDSGATWNQGPGFGFNNPISLAMSGSGQYMVLGEGFITGDIYYTDDGGVTWAATGSSTGTAPNEVYISQDGTKLAALRSDTGALTISSNSGGSWSTPVGAPASPSSIDLSTDGLTLIVGTSTGSVFTSYDFGVTWDDCGYQCDTPYVSVSGNGANMCAMDFAGAVRVSIDGGATWGDQTPISAVPILSEDGLRIFANSGSTIYIADFEGPLPEEPPADPPDPDGGAESPVTPVDGAVQSNPGDSAVMVTTTIVPPIVFGQRAIAWSETLQMFVGSVGTKIYTSANGKDWTLRHTTLDESTVLGGPSAWGGDKFVVTGQDGALFTSTDGVTWTKQTNLSISEDYPYLGETVTFLSMSYGDGKFVGTFELYGAFYIQNILYSDDGILWNLATPFFGVQGVPSRTTTVYAPEREQYVNTDGASVYTSSNAIVWDVLTLDDVEGSLSNVVWTGEKFVSVDQAGNIFTSRNAVDWVIAPSAMGIAGTVSLVMVGDTIVGISEGRVFTSGDAQVWFKYNVPAVSGSAQLVTDNRRGYAYSAASLTIIYLAAGAKMLIPSLEVLATGYNDAEDPIGIGRAKLTLPMLDVEAVASEDSNARFKLPMLIVSGYGRALGGVAQIKLPKLSVKATGKRGTPNAARIKLPKMRGEAYGGAQSATVLPKLRVVAEGTVTVVGRARIKLPKLTAMAAGNGGTIGQARIEIGANIVMQAYGGAQARAVIAQGLQVLATGSSGSVGRAQFKLPMLTLLAEGTPAPTGSAEITLPMLRMVPSALARIVLPGLKLYAIGHAEIDIEYEAYAVNLLNSLDSNPRNTFEASVNEVTHYTNYPFKQIVAFNGQYYGVAEDGLHVLDGDTDAGEPIAWSFRTALSDMKSKKLKRMISVYTGGRVIEGMEVTIVIGEAQDLEYTYTTPRGANAQNYRTMFGKGVRTRWAALQYSDPLGKAVTIDSIDIETEILERAI